MAEPARIHSHPQDVVSRLALLGVADEHVHESVRRGLSARLTTNRLHPPSFPGVYQWAETHHALRATTTRLGWTSNDDGNFSTTVSPDGETAITVATGDQFTGTRGPRQPSTKYPRGAQTEYVVQVNRTLSLFDKAEEAEAPPERATRRTWFLLIHTDRDLGEVRYELSCAAGQDADGRVTEWSERILFDPLRFEPASEPPDDEPGLPDIDIPVDRI